MEVPVKNEGLSLETAPGEIVAARIYQVPLGGGVEGERPAQALVRLIQVAHPGDIVTDVDRPGHGTAESQIPLHGIGPSGCIKTTAYGGGITTVAHQLLKWFQAELI